MTDYLIIYALQISTA